MKTIDQHIKKDQTDFLSALSDHDEGKVRHLTEELQWLIDHKRSNPNDDHDPTSLELFCENHPDDLQCLVYEY